MLKDERGGHASGLSHLQQIARSWARTSSARLLALLLLTSPACNLGRGPEDMKAVPPSDVKFAIEAPCTVPAAQGAVEAAASELELSVEEASQAPGQPWVLRRGIRLFDPALLYRVDIVAAAGRQDATVIRVYAIPGPRNFIDTQETIAKPGSLAMRIVAACAGRGAP